MNNNLLMMKNVSKCYKTKTVLSGLEFNIQKGSVVGLLGKNGVGKTTLIKCALGLLQPQSGDITLYGEDVWDLSEEVKGKIGYVPQTSNFYPWYSVKDLIDYTASFYPKWNAELVNQLLDEWELKPKDKVLVLSEGQTQKLSIILALGHEPEFLILDEPVANLDPGARRRFIKAVVDVVADRNCTVLFSSHITSDLERIADHVGILDHGKMKFTGELGLLKDQVKKLKITFSGMPPERVDMAGALRSKTAGKEAIVVVRNFSDHLAEQIKNKYNANVEVEDLNLEDIFVELT